ncbi:hypothetical protein [Acinetobacter ursingii]|uniref:hypothetical protein n=1 Tax=Acinetobacter ursingii TaxID=108980 RepID=UPI00148F089F|nr:hypothetical protein [Acinetobacter ursingii]
MTNQNQQQKNQQQQQPNQPQKKPDQQQQQQQPDQPQKIRISKNNRTKTRKMTNTLNRNNSFSC